MAYWIKKEDGMYYCPHCGSSYSILFEKCAVCGLKLKEMEVKDPLEAKKDSGKPRPSLCPVDIIRAVTEVREDAVKGKYPDPENWKKVEPQRYWDALLRHVLAAWEDCYKRDPESGKLHLSHIATNADFLLALYEGKNDGY